MNLELEKLRNQYLKGKIDTTEYRVKRYDLCKKLDEEAKEK